MPFFPHAGTGALAGLLARRYDAYIQSVQRDLADPLFGNLDRLVVLVDLLTALHGGRATFDDTAAALAAAAGGLRWERSWLETAAALGRLRRPPPTIARVVFAATKSDHVGKQQRDNLAALLRRVVEPVRPVRAAYFAAASILCTADTTMTIEGRPLSAVRGHQAGERVAVKSYPGEVPSSPPDAEFWAHPFYALPEFQPPRVQDPRAGLPNLALDTLLVALLDDAL